MDQIKASLVNTKFTSQLTEYKLQYTRLCLRNNFLFNPNVTGIFIAIAEWTSVGVSLIGFDLDSHLIVPSYILYRILKDSYKNCLLDDFEFNVDTRYVNIESQVRADSKNKTMIIIFLSISIIILLITVILLIILSIKHFRIKNKAKLKLNSQRLKKLQKIYDDVQLQETESQIVNMEFQDFDDIQSVSSIYFIKQQQQKQKEQESISELSYRDIRF